MILLIDNYDSFTYNLKQYIEVLGHRCDVVRNDAITIDAIAKLKPSQIVLSPGPGVPEAAGIMLEAIRAFAGKIPILGVCLGHQAIGQAFGGRIVHAPKPMHGKLSSVKHQGAGVFRGLPNPLKVARYHSLAVERSSLPACLEITAESEDGVVMGLRHRQYYVEGVQFHPESVATESGLELLSRFFQLCQVIEDRS